MLKSYIAVAIRHLLSQRLYSLINIGGFAIGLTCFILIALFVQHELSFDRQQPDADRIYRVSRDFFPGGESNLDLELASIAPRAAALMREDFPEIERTARMFREDVALRRGDVTSSPRTYWVDNELFEIFAFDWLRGEPATALAEPNTIVLTESVAQRFFGAADPIGETLTYGDQEPLRVTGVIRDLGDTTHLRFDALGPLATVAAWQPPNSSRSGATTPSIPIWTEAGRRRGANRRGIRSVLRAPLSGGRRQVHGLQPHRAHRHPPALESRGRDGTARQRGDGLLVRRDRLFVLLIACINFMNLSTARSVQRGKEVGVRKAIGADRRQIVLQFLGESWFATTIATVLAVAFVEVLLPGFNTSSARTPVRLSARPARRPGARGARARRGTLRGELSGILPVGIRSGACAQGRRDARPRGRRVSACARDHPILDFYRPAHLNGGRLHAVKFANAIEPGYAKEGVVC